MKKEYLVMVAFSLLICLSMVYPETLFAGGIGKVFKELNKGHYAKAREHINSTLEKDSSDIAANYTLAIWFYNEDNSKSNIDSANIFSRLATETFNQIDSNSKDLKKLSQYGIRDFALKQLQYHINERAFINAETASNLKGWQHFVNYYGGSSRMPFAIEKRNEAAFKAAKGEDDYESFKEFLNSYPDAREANKARELYEHLLYRNKTQDSTWQSYMKFTETHPESPYFEEALRRYQKLRFAEVHRIGSIDSYQEYIKEQPYSPYVTEAHKKIYDLYTEKSSIPVYKSFIKKYPASPHINDAWMRIYILATYDNSSRSYEEFLYTYPDFPNKERLLNDLILAKKELEPFEKNGKYGFRVIQSVEVAIEPIYFEVSPFSEGLSAVSFDLCGDENCNYGFINKRGEVMIEGIYDEAIDFKDGRAMVGKGNCKVDSCKWGFIDHQGIAVSKMIYNDLYDYSERRALAYKSGMGYGFLDWMGNEITPFHFDDAKPFNNGRAAIKMDSLWGFIDKSGRVYLEPSFYEVQSYSEGMAAFKDATGRWGFLNAIGQIRIKAVYEEVEAFTGGLARVSLLVQGNSGKTQKRVYFLKPDGVLIEDN